jgi:hypothetical protein
MKALGGLSTVPPPPLYKARLRKNCCSQQTPLPLYKAAKTQMNRTENTEQHQNRNACKLPMNWAYKNRPDSTKSRPKQHPNQNCLKNNLAVQKAQKNQQINELALILPLLLVKN